MEADVDTVNDETIGGLLDEENAENALFACRGCLATDTKLFKLYEKDLYEAFEDVVGNPVFEADDMPQHLCQYCATLVRKFILFRDRCRKTQDLLDEVVCDGKEITMDYIKSINRNRLRLGLKLECTNVIHTDNVDRKEDEDIFTHSINEMTIRKFIETVDVLEDLQDEQGYESDDKSDDGKRLTDSEDDGVVDPTDLFFKNILPKVISSAPIENLEEKHEELKKTSKKGRPKKVKLPELASTFQFGEANGMLVAELTPEQQLQEFEQMKLNQEQRGCLLCHFCAKNFRLQVKLDVHMKMSHNPSAQLECHICRFRSNDKSRMEIHLQKHKYKFSCKTCRYTTHNREAVKKHHEGHGDPQAPTTNYSCQFCEKVFSQLGACVCHVRSTHQQQLPMCRFCGESAMCEAGLRRHVNRWHKEILNSEHQCKKCESRFKTSEALDNHESGSPEICSENPCLQCGESLETLELLRHHLAQHLVRGSLSSTKCNICNIQFTYTRALYLHSQAPCAKREHTCVQCGWSAQEAGTLGEHLTSHEMDNFQCDNCDRELRDRYRLQTHYIFCIKNPLEPNSGHRVSKGQGIFRGLQPERREKLWGVSGGRLTALRSDGPDLVRASEATNICHICAAAFTEPRMFTAHMRTHEGRYRCDFCQKNCHNKSKLIEHIRTHTGEKPLQCPHCEKAFRTKAAYNRHEVVHSGFRRHICQICQKTFKTSSVVKSHIKAVHMNIKPKPRIRNRKKLTEEPLVYPTNESYPSRSYENEEYSQRYQIDESDSPSRPNDDRDFQIIGTNVARKRPKAIYLEQPTSSHSTSGKIRLKTSKHHSKERPRKKMRLGIMSSEYKTSSYPTDSSSYPRDSPSYPRDSSYPQDSPSYPRDSPSYPRDSSSYSLDSYPSEAGNRVSTPSKGKRYYDGGSKYNPSDDVNVRPLGPPKGKRPMKVLRNVQYDDETNVLLQGIPDGYAEGRRVTGGKFKPGYYYSNMPELD